MAKVIRNSKNIKNNSKSNNKNYKTKKTKKSKTKKTKKLQLHHHTSTLSIHNTTIPRVDYKKHYLPLTQLRGGRFLDKGGYGCVVTPAIACNKNDKNLANSVSKIVRIPTDTITEELNMSKILKNIDKESKYFITFDNYCYINKIPEDRTDLADVVYKDAEYKKYSFTNNTQKKKTDKKFCDIDLSLKPINIIMPYGGYSLTTILKSDRKDNTLLSRMNQMFVDNLKEYFKHLLVGLLKMHNNRIVNRDVKERNIIAKLNQQGTGLDIRYIDFGLSNFLSSNFANKYENISVRGTTFYIPPDLFICKIISKYPNQNRKYHMNKIMNSMDDSIIKAFGRIKEKKTITNLQNKLSSIYNHILELYNEKKLLDTYFGTDTNKQNGYLQKADIYALGLSIYEGLYAYSKIDVRTNIKLHDLLMNMLNINPEKRYNVSQCLSHPYFRKEDQ